MDVFLCNLRPRSVRAKTPERYKDGIRDAFQIFCPDSSCGPGPLYASIYYEEILDSLLEMLEREDHVLYVELGRLSFQQFRFGYELMET